MAVLSLFQDDYGHVGFVRAADSVMVPASSGVTLQGTGKIQDVDQWVNSC